jgi:hypothetical protein
MNTRVLSLFKGLTGLLILSGWTSPHLAEQTDFRASLRLKPVISNRTSPALAALEDTRLIYNDTDIAPASTLAVQTLRTGRKFAWTTQPALKIQLPQAVISQNTKIDHLRELVGEVQDKPTATISVTDYAEILVKEELLKRAHENKTSARVITSSTGTNIVITPPQAIAAAGAPAHKANSVVVAQAAKPNPAPKFEQVIANAPKKITSAPNIPIILAANMKAVPSADPFAPEVYEISGALTFEKGAAMLGGKQNLTVQQVIDGQVVASGDINFVDASYHISLSKLEGDLIASLRGQNGQLIAEASADLGLLSDKYLNQHRIRGVSLSIVPATSETEAVVVAAGALGSKKTPIAGARLRIEDLDREIVYNKKEKAFVDSTLVSPSTFIVRAEAPNYWSTIGIAQSGEKFQLQLLPLKLIEALLSLTLDKYSAREAIDQGIVWGHVLMGGHPVEGAQIGIVGESEKTPVYFTGFIPDKTRHTTATGGEYSFTRLEPGEKMIRVNLAEKIFWPVLLPIQSKAVTYADLQIEPRRAIDFKSSIAFSSTPVAAEIQALGTPDKMLIPESGSVRIENETISGVSFFEGTADATHETIRASLRPGQTEIRFPFITKAWVEQARAKLNLKNDEQTGSALFFVNGDEYDVIVGAAADDRAQNIVYFDAQGKFTAHPADGGGFIVLNLPAGFHAITLIPERSKKVVTQLVYTDHFAVSAETINLMY